jgi:hypothetical protein
MSLLGKNILNDLLKQKQNGNKPILNSSNILNKTSKYNKIPKNQLVKKIETTEIEEGNAPYYLMYFLHNAFDGNHDLLGFKFLWYYLTESEKIKNSTLKPQTIFNNYFKESIKVKKIISYFLSTFYDKFLGDVIGALDKKNPGDLIEIETFIKNFNKDDYKDTYYQILPFNLLFFIVKKYKISTEISNKFIQQGKEQEFIDFSIRLYNIYNKETSSELMIGFFPYLLENLQFQILIADIGLKKIGKGIGDKLWIYRIDNYAGVQTSDKTDKIDIKKLDILGEIDISKITDDEYSFLIIYKKFIKDQIKGPDETKVGNISSLMESQIERLNLIKEKYLIKSISNISQVGGDISEDYIKLLNTERLEIKLNSDNKTDIILGQILINTINLLTRLQGKSLHNLRLDLKILKEIYLKKYQKFKDTISSSITNPPLDKWVECGNSSSGAIPSCKENATKYIQFETESTLYYLIFLVNSFIQQDTNIKLKLIFNGSLEQLNGKWENDMKFFKLDKDQFNKKSGRLIMGFGPSASGKTYWAKNIIQMLHGRDPKNFPSSFLSIDGGIMRETSITYQILKNVAKEKKTKGFKNLAGGLSMLFSSGSVKKKVEKFLKQSGQPKPNLYVPHTISECGFDIGISENKQIRGCKKTTYQKYIDITKDSKWIGLMIYQHKTREKCPYQEIYKCKGCTESGKEREIDEGKIYSSEYWETSYKHGMRQYKKAPGDKILIHNSGQIGFYSLIYSPNLEFVESELDKLKLKICKTELCKPFIEKDVVVLGQNNINVGGSEIPYEFKENIYTINLPSGVNNKGKQIFTKYIYDVKLKTLRMDGTGNKFLQRYSLFLNPDENNEIDLRDIDLNSIFIVCLALLLKG